MTKSEKLRGKLELNWVNRDKSLLYEYDEAGNPVRPKKWVDEDDIRVSEPRILKLKKQYGENDNENMLIKGDNLLALKTLVEEFKNRKEENKVKCIYIDPPFNTGQAFDSYDDNLEHSEWLTMMRDRLVLLRKLLRKNGSIFVHIDNRECDYLKVLMDSIFGRTNFINRITVAATSPSSFKIVNPGVFDEAEYLLHYAKNKEKWQDKTLYVPSEYDENYNKIIINPNEPISKWKISTVKEEFLKEINSDRIPILKNACQEIWANCRSLKPKEISGYLTHHFRYCGQIDVNAVSNQIRSKLRKGSKKEEFIHWCFWYLLEKISYPYADKDLHKFVLENSDRVFRFTEISESGAGKETVKIKKRSEKHAEDFFVVDREEYPDRIIKEGKEITFYEKKTKTIEGKKTSAKILTNIWNDIAWEGIANEGHVRLKKGKKPEKLLKRVIEIGSDPGDLVLDSFLGSGTTCAVAHKMNRRWIGIELLPDHVKKSIKRLRGVIDKKKSDRTGISKNEDVNWQGGGGFRYYELGGSLISDKSEINWKLTKDEIARGVFMNFGYTFEEKLEDGVFVGNDKEKYAICAVTKRPTLMGKAEIERIIGKLEAVYGKSNVGQIDIYTNQGIKVKEEYLPGNVNTKKIPNSILERYNL